MMKDVGRDGSQNCAAVSGSFPRAAGEGDAQPVLADALAGADEQAVHVAAVKARVGQRGGDRLGGQRVAVRAGGDGHRRHPQAGDRGRLAHSPPAPTTAVARP